MVRLAMLAVCLAASSFMVRVLAALLSEWTAPAPLSIKGYLARFVPSRKRGKLIMMNGEILKRKVSTKSIERIALVFLLAVGLASPVRAQQTQNGPQGPNPAGAQGPNPTDSEANRATQPVSQEV